MYKVVFLRHGESVWNKENRFTGWTDVDLSEKGIVEAKNSGKVLETQAGFSIVIPGMRSPIKEKAIAMR